MAKNELIKVICFNQEIGSLGWDEDKSVSYFQYNPRFLETKLYSRLIPETRIIKPVRQVQVFRQFNGETFRGLPPFFADSLPDVFGNIIFKTWLESKNKDFSKISVIEQLAYVANRGMGALEYKPRKEIPKSASINIDEITEVLKKVLEIKENASEEMLDSKSLLNIFKIGTSAGGARPKILISENKLNGKIIPGDINFSKDYNHYLVKLNLENEENYNREIVEFVYYLTALKCGIRMSESHLIEGKHFATKRFDRVDGKKKHVLTASGMTGWDFKNPEVSSYENLFDLSVFLKIPHSEIEQLFRRMVFNLVFANSDDHLKNHAYVYDEENDVWNLSPAYDITYSLNPLFNYTKVTRALSVNGKRTEINIEDLEKLAQKYTVKNPKKIISEVQNEIEFWKETAQNLKISQNIIEAISKDFMKFD